MVKSRTVVPILALIVIFYAVLGGLSAAAITDTLQGILILILSFILLPAGLIKVGGFSGLHAKLPEHVLQVFGSVAKSEYTIPYIISIVLLNLAGYLAQPQNIATAGGAAKDELTARIGFVTGSFMKRFCTVLWAITGIIGFALFAQSVSDPDTIWGYMTLELLGSGFVGLMLVCLIAAMMSTCDAYMLSGGALITKNIYMPLNPEKNDKHYLLFGKFASAAIVLVGMGLSIKFNNILSIMKQIWTLAVVFGPAFWLAIIWRRATTKAIWGGVVLSFFISFLGPTFLPSFDFISKNPKFLIMTKPISVPLKNDTRVSQEPSNVSAETEKLHPTVQAIPPASVFFDNIVHENPHDPKSPLKGIGRFRIQIIILKSLGLNASRLTTSQLNTAVFLFDALVPFLLLILLSLLTKSNDKAILDRFYARLHTPVDKDSEKDAAEVQMSYDSPTRWNDKKLFPNSSIEILRPNREDLSGFFISCLVVVGIVGMLYGLATLQWP
jgi:SSS family solute:Na+ symporter